MLGAANEGDDIPRKMKEGSDDGFERTGIHVHPPDPFYNVIFRGVQR